MNNNFETFKRKDNLEELSYQEIVQYCEECKTEALRRCQVLNVKDCNSNGQKSLYLHLIFGQFKEYERAVKQRTLLEISILKAQGDKVMRQEKEQEMKYLANQEEAERQAQEHQVHQQQMQMPVQKQATAEQPRQPPL